MRSQRAVYPRLIALLCASALVLAACGGDDDDAGTNGEGGDPDADASEVIDYGTFVGDPPSTLDPALVNTVESYQVVNALYDGLTDADVSDPDNPRIVPLVADTVESNEDATVWTFTIGEGQTFSDGEPVLPSSFVRGWERASNPDFAGAYSYLFTLIEGGAEKLDGAADTISGVVADDDAMTLTVTLAQPYSNFDAVAGFQLFAPMPSAVDELEDQNDWDQQLIGNGPYMLEGPWSDEEIVIVRNDRWAGDIAGNTRANVDRIVFRTSTDLETAFQAFEAGEGHTAPMPTGGAATADENYASTLDVDVAGVYFFAFNWTDPQVGGPENLLLRQAISQAIDRDEINEAVYEGTRTTATGITPPGIPGAEEGLCEFCSYDPDAALAAFEEWQDAGNSLSEPVRIVFNIDAGQEDVVQIVIDNLATIGIEAQADGRPNETYFDDLVAGACVVCRSGWFADYPTYDNFTYDLFHSDTIGGNNLGEYSNPEFDSLVDEARSETDPERRSELFRQAEQVLLNDDIAVVPINWYRGNYVYDPDRIATFPQTSMGLILWEQVELV